jgi:hypothetical protein
MCLDECNPLIAKLGRGSLRDHACRWSPKPSTCFVIPNYEETWHNPSHEAIFLEKKEAHNRGIPAVLKQ